MADSDQNQRKDLKGKAPMSSSSATPETELPNLPEPQCLKDLIGKCSKPFEREFTFSDKTQCRFTLRKDFVKNEFLPMLEGEGDVKNGVPVTVYGPDAIKGYKMSFCCWQSSKYVLNKGWKEFADEYDLKPEEHFVTVWMFRHKTTKGFCFAFTWRHVPKEEKEVAPMPSSSSATPGNELPNLPEPQCLKDLIGKCSKPFEREFTFSDKTQCRFALLKDFVKNEFLPMLEGEDDVKNGVPVIVYGPDAIKGYSMSFCYWQSSKGYVLNKGWKEFADEYDLKPEEHFVTVWMFRHKTTKGLCFAFTWRHVPKEEKEIAPHKTLSLDLKLGL